MNKVVNRQEPNEINHENEKNFIKMTDHVIKKGNWHFSWQNLLTNIRPLTDTRELRSNNSIIHYFSRLFRHSFLTIGRTFLFLFLALFSFFKMLPFLVLLYKFYTNAKKKYLTLCELLHFLGLCNKMNTRHKSDCEIKLTTYYHFSKLYIAYNYFYWKIIKNCMQYEVVPP